MNIVKCSEEQGLNKGQPAFILETNHIKAQMGQATGSEISENSALQCCLGKGRNFSTVKAHVFMKITKPL